MNTRITLLAALLAIQLVIVLLMNMGSDSDDPTTGLLNIAADSVSEIIISANDGASVTLRREAGGWRLMSDDVAIAADDAKVTDVLTRLTGMDSLWPVAASASSRERFEVAPDNFQQRLEFSGDGVDAQVYLGNSPGYRRIHASNGESDNVYSIEFASYDVPVDPSEWLDKNQLQRTGVSRLTLTGSWQLAEVAEGWQINEQNADAESATQMIRRVEQLRLIGVYQGDSAALPAPRELEIRIGEETEVWSFRHDAEADEYVLTSSRLPGQFTVTSYTAEQILVDAASLLPAPETPTENSSGSPPEGSGMNEALPSES